LEKKGTKKGPIFFIYLRVNTILVPKNVNSINSEC